MKETELLSYQELMDSCLQQLKDEKLADWLIEKHNHGEVARIFFTNFGLIGRKIPRLEVTPTPSVEAHLKQLNPGFNKLQWTLDDFCRLSLLLSLNPATNIGPITQLLAAADMREQVIIYKALPYLFNAADFVWLAIDGLRTNMVDVFDAIALDNVYPYRYFPDEAWNQMVLKAIFMERPIYRIWGLEKRTSQTLAEILYDFIHERWSAGRQFTPELWRLVYKYMNPAIFEDLRKVIQQEVPIHREAAIKALQDADYPEAIAWLQTENLGIVRHTWEEIGKLIFEGK